MSAEDKKVLLRRIAVFVGIKFLISAGIYYSAKAARKLNEVHYCPE